ncbi:hypothetical protein D1BOALGB6SA_914 [Olavius sp. associated proteobacterium Delta 1]|nr:hypothetical protein D1BOALGB6SA_914 [Olavius sp. associated proteobacterium Delta 1]
MALKVAPIHHRLKDLAMKKQLAARRADSIRNLDYVKQP